MKRRKAREQAASTTVGYVRVSTQEQATNGVSLDAQEARIVAYCTALGWQVSEVIRDAGESAKSLKRPGISRILEGVRGGTVGRVVILKLDRVTRSTRDLANLLDTFAKADASLVSVSESLDTLSAAGRLVVNMLGVVAQWEREAIGERTASALAHKATTSPRLWDHTVWVRTRGRHARSRCRRTGGPHGSAPHGPRGGVIPQDRRQAHLSRHHASPLEHLARGLRSSNSTFADRDGGEPLMKYDTPRITAAMRRNPQRMPSRQAVYERFRSVIARAVPEYSEEELNIRAESWTCAAITKGAIMVEEP